MTNKAATEKPSTLNPIKKALPYLALIFLIFSTVLVWQYYKETTSAREERRFNEYADYAKTSIYEQIEQNKMVLKGVAGVFAATAEVDQEEWSAYFEYQQIVTGHPGIRDAEFAMVVQPSELEQHLEALRAEGHLEYTVWPEGERELYTPVVFVAPFTESYRAGLGFDMYSDPLRRATMENARDSGAAAISGKMTIMTETGPAPPMGFIMVLPVFKTGAQPDTPEERPAAIMGYVSCFFRIEELMAGIFTDPTQEIDFHLYDGTEISAETLLYGSHISPEEDRERRPLFTSTETIDLYGHQWTMVFESMSAFEMAANSNAHWAVLAVGLLISFLIFFYLKSMQHMTTVVSKSEVKHRRLFETMTQGVIYQAPDGRIISANPAAERCLGLTFDQMQDKTSMDPRWQMIEEDGTPVSGEEHPTMIALRTGQTVGPVTRGIYRPDLDSYCWISITAIPLFRPSEAEPFQSHAVFENVTARKQAEEEISTLNEELEQRVEERTDSLIESEQQLKKITDNVTDAVAMCNIEGNFTYLSPQSHRVLGFSPAELLGRPIFSIVYEEDLPAIMQQFSDSLEAKEPRSAEYRIATKDGHLVWVETRGELLHDNGQVSGAVLVTRDITGRKQAEEELRRQGRRTEALLKIGSRLNAELKLDKVREAICEESCSALRVKMSAYLSYNVINQRFDLTASSGLPEELASAFAGLSQEGYNGIIGKLGKAGAIPDLAAMPELPYVQLLLRHGIKSFVYAVIERDELPLGIVLAGDNGEEFDLPEDAVALLSGLAAQAASAVTNARLLQETRESLRQVQALRNIDLAITGSLDLRVTFQVVLDEVTGMLNTDAAAILLVDPYSGTLKYEQWRGFHSKDLKSIILPQGKGYGGRAAAERQTIHIADLKKVEPEPVQGALLAEEGFAAYFGVPLIAKGKVKGVLEIYHREPVETNSNWLAFMETLGGQAAIAVDNAELFSSLEHSSVDLLQAYDATIEGWAHALDLKDEGTEGHSRRVTEITVELARKMNVKDEELAHVRRGALLHDIGKMGIPDSILLKPGKLTDEEWVIMRMHPVYAYEMLAPVDYLRTALDIPYCHHEKWDGSGYPRGLKGEAIPLPARIFAVVDVYDALTSDRPYRKAWSEEDTLTLIKKDSGSHFDPQVVEVFLKRSKVVHKVLKDNKANVPM